MSALRSHVASGLYKQIRFYCTSENPGKILHLKTLPNELGNSVLKAFAATPATSVSSCGVTLMRFTLMILLILPHAVKNGRDILATGILVLHTDYMGHLFSFHVRAIFSFLLNHTSMQDVILVKTSKMENGRFSFVNTIKYRKTHKEKVSEAY